MLRLSTPRRRGLQRGETAALKRGVKEARRRLERFDALASWARRRPKVLEIISGLLCLLRRSLPISIFSSFLAMRQLMSPIAVSSMINIPISPGSQMWMSMMLRKSQMRSRTISYQLN